MLFVADDPLVLLLLTQLVMRLECGRAAVLLRAGVDPEHLEKLRALHLPDLRVLAASATPIVSLAIDPEALARSFRALADRNEFLQLRDAFIENGAPPALMRVLFGLSEKATFARRRELNVQRGRGRPPLPPRGVREAIEARWCEIRELDPRRRYLALRDAFPEISLDALYVIITEHEGPLNERNSPLAVSRRRMRLRGIGAPSLLPGEC
jgi:hypothetical protein